MMKRTDFKNLSKNDVLSIASKLGELRPDVAKEVIAQFPEFSRLIQSSMEEYKDILGNIISSDDESLKQVYAVADKDINADIFFHTPYKMLDKLETPFGDIHVKINEKTVPFRYRTSTYEDGDNTKGKPVLMHIIDIDMSELNQEDIVFCGFDNNILEYNDSDERVVMHSCESEKQILGLSAFEPDDEEAYCYQLEDYGGDGFGYRVTTDPDKFDAHHFWQSKITSLYVAVLDKADYEDPDLVLFLALC